MKDLAITLRAAQLYAQNAHQLTTGVSFLPDHTLLGDYYEAYAEAYDMVVERLIGVGQAEGLDLVQLQQDAVDLLKTYPNADYMRTLIQLEQRIQTQCDMYPNASTGTANLLAQIADDSEVRTYKLRQRTS